MVDWHALSREEVFDNLKTKEGGLSQTEADLRLKKYGKNELSEVLKINIFSIILQQFKSVFVYILLFVAIFSIFIHHYLDFIVVSVIVLLNAGIGFFQQYKAEKTIFELKNFLVPKVQVFREGQLKEILSSQLVPGDIIQISDGDKIMADCRIIHSIELEVNEAILTGESFAQIKTTEKLKQDTDLANRENMLFMGTIVVSGSAKAVVVSTGMQTEFGKIAGIVQKIEIERTPLEKKLNEFSKKIAIGVLILAILSIFIGIYRGEEIFDMILTGVALAVSVIPEGVPAIIAITLALAIGRMKKHNALIRRLPAAETLGRTTVICVDKTGTLTEEEMTVTNLYCGKEYYHIKNNSFFHENTKIDAFKNFNLSTLLKIGVLCNNARIEKDKAGKIISVIGDPTEKSFLISADLAGIFKKQETEKENRIMEYSFSSKRKFMSIVRHSEKGIVNYVKGAPDVIIKRSTKEFFQGRTIPLTEKRKDELIKIYENMAASALRVLGFAFKKLDNGFNQEIAESGLTFIGFQGIMDPPRKEVKASISECLAAGIKIKMITGDSLVTAKAVSDLIGLDGGVIEESNLRKLSKKDFNDTVRMNTIFARITPQTKFRIIQSLKEQGEVVAVTGDGVNDVLALKEANIGVAMGIRGTSVAREVSDIVLLDDNFSSIVRAVREGRKVYDNLKKSITAHLAANLGELFIVLFALLLALPLPMLPLAILWMNLITDSLPSLALAVEPEDKGIMKRKPISKNETILTGIVGFLIFAGLYSFLVSIGLFSLFYQTDLDIARTMTMTAAIFCEMFIVMSCRSKRNVWEIGPFSNRFLTYSILTAIVLQLIAVYTPLGLVFGFKALLPYQLFLTFIVSAPILVIFEVKKYLASKKEENADI